MKRLVVVFVLLTSCHLTTKAQMEKDSVFESVLDMSIEELMNTKVRIATKSGISLNEAPAVVTVITSEEIQNMGARTLPEILQYIPGFEYSVSKIGFYTVGVRGVKDPLTNARLLIMKDGVAYNGIMYGTGIGIVHLLDLNTIEKIEVIRGPGSALYGRNAFSGVVNVITKSAHKAHDVDARVTAGNFNTNSFGASYGFKPDDKFETIISFEKTKSDLTDSKFDNGLGGEDLWERGYDNTHLNMKTKFNDFELNAFYSDYSISAFVGPYVTESFKKVKLGIYSLDYTKEINNKLAFRGKVYLRDEDHKQLLEIFQPDVNPVAPNGMYATPSFRAYTFGGDLNVSYNLKKSKTLLGIQFDKYGLTDVQLKSSYDTYSGTPLTYIDNEGNIIYRGENDQVIEERGWIEDDGHDYSNLAIYVQEIFTPFKSLSLTGGLRMDFDSEIGFMVNPRAAVVWHANQKTNLKLLYGRAFRAPNAQEQYRLTGFTKGNKDLEPEIIHTYELSANYGFTKEMNGNITLFYNKLDNLIYSESSVTGAPDTTYSNIGQNTSMGIEVEYKIRLNKSITAYTNYSYTHSEDKVLSDTAYPHRDIAPHKINGGINVGFLKYFNFNTNVVYGSEREKYTRFDPTSGEIVNISQDVVGNYVLVNAKLRIMNVVKNLELSTEVYNLFNAEYYDQDNRNAYSPKGSGRHLIFTLTYNLFRN